MSAPGRYDSVCSCRPWSLLDMLRFYARPFLDARNLIRTVTHAFASQQINVVAPEALNDIREKIETIISDLESLSLPISAGRARRVRTSLGGTGVKPAMVYDAFRSLDELIEEEIEAVCFVSLTPYEASFFDPPHPVFGVEVDAKFPGSVFEIEEAAKCYGLGRYTASAFHSIRCLESAIRAISRCLGIPDPTKAANRNWGRMLDNVKGEIGTRWPTNSDRLSGDGKMFDEVHAALAAMQNPWRNATMHLDQKYTAEEAKHIFDMLGGLMRRAASRMDEDGQPLA